MDIYIGLGFFVLCVGISVSLVIGIASIMGYYVHLSRKKLEVSPQQETPKSTTHE